MSISTKFIPSYYLIVVCMILISNTASGQGKVIDDKFFSKALDKERLVDIYLPEGYDSTSALQQFPVVYFLHGGWGNQDSYSYQYPILDSLIHEKIINPIIVVKPDGSMEPYEGTNYVNSALYGDIEDYITNDLIEYIDNTYNTIAQRKGRAIMGHSMGAQGSMRIALIHPELYAGVAAHSGILDGSFGDFIYPKVIEEADSTGVIKPDNGRFSMALFNAAGAYSPNLDNPPYYVDLPIDIDGNIIESVRKRFRQYDTKLLVNEYDKNLDLGIYLDCGTNDFIYQYNVSFAQSLDSLGIPHTFKSYDGNHSNQLVSRYPIALQFLDSVLHKRNEE